MNISVSLPISQDRIPEELAKVSKEIARVDGERKVLAALLKAIQDSCSHPNMTHYKEYDGSGGGYCKVCGYQY